MKIKITRRYLAGLIDGEGYIGIKPNRRPENRNRQHFAPMIKMALTEKSAYLLFAIRDKLGGHIYKREYPNNFKYNNAYYWDVHTYNIVKRVLDYVYPYLILKKEQAKLALELIQTKINTEERLNNGQIKSVSLEILEKRQRLYTLVKKLNKRGRAPAETKRETPTVKTEDETIVRTSGKPEEINRNANPAEELVCA